MQQLRIMKRSQSEAKQRSISDKNAFDLKSA